MEEVAAAKRVAELRCTEVQQTIPITSTPATLSQAFDGTIDNDRFGPTTMPGSGILMVEGLGQDYVLASRSVRTYPLRTAFYRLDPTSQEVETELVDEVEGIAVIDLLFDDVRDLLFMSYLTQEGTQDCVRVGLASVPMQAAAPNFTDLDVVFETDPCVTPQFLGQHGGRIAKLGSEELMLTVGDFQIGPSNLSQQIRPADFDAPLRSGGYGMTYVVDPDANPPSWRRFSEGHRNPQGLAVDAISGTIWLSEHGPGSGDEINVATEGADYGWREVTYGFPYGGFSNLDDPDFAARYVAAAGLAGLDRWCSHDTPGVTKPYALLGAASVAPSQLYILERESMGNGIPAKRTLILGTLADEALWLADITAGSGEPRAELGDWRRVSIGERIRDIDQGPDGTVYLALDSGKLMRLQPGA